MLMVKNAPTCKQEKILVVGASRAESLDIACEVETDPPVRSFKWKFNNSGETIEVSPDRFASTSNGTTSVLRYTPVSDLDYGTLSCWADNAIGAQVSPCVFQVVAAGKPFPVRNCTLSNQTSSSVEVSCQPGFDGGLPQYFLLELYSADSGVPRYNLTSSDAPYFYLANLEPDVTFRIAVFAVNSKGRSVGVVLEEVTFRDAEKRTDGPIEEGEIGVRIPSCIFYAIMRGKDTSIISSLLIPDVYLERVGLDIALYLLHDHEREIYIYQIASDGDLPLSPILGMVVGAALTLLSVVLLVVVKVRRKRSRDRGRQQGGSKLQGPNGTASLPSAGKNLPSRDCVDEKDPDIIPAKFEPGPVARPVMGNGNIILREVSPLGYPPHSSPPHSASPPPHGAQGPGPHWLSPGPPPPLDPLDRTPASQIKDGDIGHVSKYIVLMEVILTKTRSPRLASQRTDADKEMPVVPREINGNFTFKHSVRQPSAYQSSLDDVNPPPPYHTNVPTATELQYSF
uniref:Uncharacterized protein n=1 Tax=Timema monikensis TaxID=170555 RepID=A0A7R9E3M7_9NEOP|nr:unnamed protein product [Timema monikensis]